MTSSKQAVCLPAIEKATPKVPVIGVFATSDPRIDAESRTRCQNIARLVAERLAGAVVMPDQSPVAVVYSDVLVDSEAQADVVSQQLLAGREDGTSPDIRPSDAGPVGFGPV